MPCGINARSLQIIPEASERESVDYHVRRKVCEKGYVMKKYHIPEKAKELVSKPWVKWLVLLVGPALCVIVAWAIDEDAFIYASCCVGGVIYPILGIWVVLNNPATKARRAAKLEAKRRSAQTLYVKHPPTYMTKNCGKCGKPVPSTAKAGQRCPHCGAYWSFQEGVHELVYKKCGNCKRSVSDKAQVGQKCPHCGAVWNYKTDYRNDWEVKL